MAKFTEADRRKMDEAAESAGHELDIIPKEHVVPIANWFNKWYGGAGHKRLDRILSEYAE